MKRALVTVCVLAMAGLGWSTPDIWEEFKKTYSPGPKLVALSCTVCHTTVPTHNQYGKDLKAARKAGAAFNAALIKSIEGKDSDGDGWSNVEEIEADTSPGDAAAKPPGSPKAPPTPAEPAAAAGLIPKHAFHPVVIHFPIALFIFGSLLEVLGLRKKEAAMRLAGWWCLLGGSVASFGAAATGLTAFFWNGYSWEGPVLIHFILAVSSTLMMLGTVLWRRKGDHESAAYLALLLFTAVLVGVAGHFGGNLVYS